MASSSSDPGSPPAPRPGPDQSDETRLDAVRCPHCDQVTMPNMLGDGSVVCSCTAERALPLDLVRGTPWDDQRGSMPAPMDDTAAAPDNKTLPEDRGQFGRDVETEDYEPLRRPPGG